MNLREAIAKIVNREHLTDLEMRTVFGEIMSGDASAAQIGAFLTALRMKGETIDEIVGATRAMRERATFVDTGVDTENSVLMDIVGTGGDGSGSFNVSTCTSFVVAAAGVRVAKHGNRAVSSRCGAADVLEALGVNLELAPDRVAACVAEIGIGFLFAPKLHRAMKHAIGPRREIGIRTIFNILGPLTNPAGANVQLTGVFTPALTRVIAQVLMRLGMKRAIIVWGEGGLDEMTVTGATHMADAHDGRVTESVLLPEELGLKRATMADIRGGADAAASAAMVRAVLSGEPGARLDMVLLNAGTALMAAGKAVDILEGMALARELIQSGAALGKLDALAAFAGA